MDLNRIDHWTRQQLEAEARRRGIIHAEHMSHAELVREILETIPAAHALGESAAHLVRRVPGLKRAGKLVGSMLGVAEAAMPEAFGPLRELRERVTRAPARDDEPAGSVARYPSPEPPPRAAPQRPPASTRAAASPQPPSAEPPQAPAPPAARDGAPAEGGGEAPAEAAAARRPAARVEAQAPETGTRPSQMPTYFPGAADGEGRTRQFVEEPIRTLSMARLLAAQEHRERALALYEALLEQHPEDETLRGELEALRRGETVTVQLPAREPGGQQSQPPDSDEALDCTVGESQGVRLRWRISETAAQRARRELGEPGELAVRIMSLDRDAERAVRTLVTEHGPVQPQGEWADESFVPGERCIAAIGLRAGDRFVAIVHTPV